MLFQLQYSYIQIPGVQPVSIFSTMSGIEIISNSESFCSSGENGRPPKNIELMLRMYLVQNWFSLSDESTENAVYDSIAVRKFVGIDITEEDVPDSTTLLRFRHLLEENKLQEKFFQQVEKMLEKNKIIVKKGTIVDATIITAPTSVKNAKKQRDPDAKSTKKGNQYYFGYKAHIGVDSESGLVHTNIVTSANEHDVTVTNKLLHGEEQCVYGDSGYLGADKRENAPDDVPGIFRGLSCDFFCFHPYLKSLIGVT